MSGDGEGRTEEPVVEGPDDHADGGGTTDGADHGPGESRFSRRRLEGAAARSRRALSQTIRIARWEAATRAGTVDRRTVLALVAMAALVGAVGVSALDDGAGLEEGIYLVGVDEDSPYHDVAAESARFRAVDPERDDVDVVVDESGRILPSDRAGGGTHRSGTAYDAFRDAIRAYNDERMAAEPDQAAAYPVRVSIRYQRRADPTGTTAGADSSADGDRAGSGDGTGSGPGDGDSLGGDGGLGDDGWQSGDDSRLQVPDVGAGSDVESTEAGTPGAISPPFPFRSLVLAFLFVVPMNFVIQAYGSTIMNERINRRGELLLVAPVSRHRIVAGKTLPYLLASLAIVVAVAAAIGGGATSVAAAIPIALLFLAATFVAALLARSFKELTFVTVAISVFLTTYTFVPAIFTDVAQIALISPLSLVVMDLQATGVTPGQYLFSTAPFYVGSAVCFLFGIGVYREEDMFARKPIPAKAIDALASRLAGKRSVFLLSILVIPFVFAAELLAVALLFALPRSLSLPVLFVAIALIEEVAKSAHVYAGFATSRFEASIRTAIGLGALAGAGFFVGEKLTHVVQLVGLPELEIGRAAFGPALSLEAPILLVLFLAPLALHVCTAVVSAIGARKGRRTYAAALACATAIHACYNLGVTAIVA